VNDISGLRFEPRLAEVARRHGTPLVLMHLRGRPQTMQRQPFARDIWRSLAKGIETSIRRALAADDPGNVGAGRDLAWSLGAVGRTLEALGDRDGALDAWQACLGVRRTLSAADPGSSGWRNDIVMTEQMIAGLRSA